MNTDLEQALRDGLRDAANHAPAWDDSLLPPAQAARRRPGWVAPLAAAAAVTLVVSAGVWGASLTRQGQAVPAASTSPSAAIAPTPTDAGGLAADGTRSLVGTTWVMEGDPKSSLRDYPLALRPWIRLGADGAFTGHDGCNSLSGRYFLDGVNIGFFPNPHDLTGCAARPIANAERALRPTATVQVSGSTLRLIDVWGADLATFQAVTPTDEEPPAVTQLRIINNTGKVMTKVELRDPDNRELFENVPPYAASPYRSMPLSIYRYAAINVTFADGTSAFCQPADFVGERPLAVGRYTFVLTPQEPSTPAGFPLWPQLEESGRIAWGR